MFLTYISKQFIVVARIVYRDSRSNLTRTNILKQNNNNNNNNNQINNNNSPYQMNRNQTNTRTNTPIFNSSRPKTVSENRNAIINRLQTVLKNSSRKN